MPARAPSRLASGLARLPSGLAGLAGLALVALLAAAAAPARAEEDAPPRLDPLALEARLRAVAAKVIPSTVLIRASDALGERSAYGSGVVIDPDGHALTCAHVVEGASELEATLADGRAFRLTLVGLNKGQDYALVKLEGASEPFAACPLGDSRAVQLGDWVAALGHPAGPYPDLQPAFAVGRVTGLHRRIPIQAFERYYDDAIRTDIPIFPGNSGGPLVDLEGRLVGINGAILLLNENSYAVPLDEIEAHLDRLRRGEHLAGRKASGLPLPLGEFGERDLVRFVARFVKRAFGKGGLGAPFAGPEGEHNETTRMLERFGEALGDERFLGDLAKALAGEGEGQRSELDAMRRLMEAWGKPDASIEDLVGPLGELFGPPGGAEPGEAADPFEEMVRGLLGGGQNGGGDLLRRLLDELSGGAPDPEPEAIERAVERMSARELRELIESTDEATLRRMAQDLGPERLGAMLERLSPADIEALLAGPRGPALREIFAELLAKKMAPGGAAPPRAPPTPAPAAPAPAAPAPGEARPYLGVAVDFGAEATERIRGVLVFGVAPGSPAEAAGVRPGDVIVGLAGAPLDHPDQLEGVVRDLRPGDRIAVEVLRTRPGGIPLGERQHLELQVGAR